MHICVKHVKSVQKIDKQQSKYGNPVGSCNAVILSDRRTVSEEPKGVL